VRTLFRQPTSNGRSMRCRLRWPGVDVPHPAMGPAIPIAESATRRQHWHHTAMPVASRSVQAAPTRQHDIGAFQQGCLRAAPTRRKAEGTNCPCSHTRSPRRPVPRRVAASV
jgi:hypothetical protein